MDGGEELDGNRSVEFETIDLAERTLLGDLRDQVLTWFRQQTRVLRDFPEAEQREFAIRVSDACRDVIRKTAELMVTAGAVVIHGDLDKIDITDKGIVGKIVFHRADDKRLSLYDAQGTRVSVSLVNIERFQGERGPAPIDPDQPGLPIEALQVHPDDEFKDEIGDDPDGPVPGDPAEPEPRLKAVKLGEQAWRHGVNREQNIFPVGTPEHAWWLEGWDSEEARADDPPEK